MTTKLNVERQYNYKYLDRQTRNSVERALDDLFKAGRFDVKITTKDGVIGAHRFVLEMFSKTYREMVKKTTTNEPVDHVLSIFDTTSNIMGHMLDLFYYGHTIICADASTEFETLLRILRVNGVKRMLELSGTVRGIKVDQNKLVTPNIGSLKQNQENDKKALQLNGVGTGDILKNIGISNNLTVRRIHADNSTSNPKKIESTGVNANIGDTSNVATDNAAKNSLLSSLKLSAIPELSEVNGSSVRSRAPAANPTSNLHTKAISNGVTEQVKVTSADGVEGNSENDSFIPENLFKVEPESGQLDENSDDQNEDGSYHDPVDMDIDEECSSKQ